MADLACYIAANRFGYGANPNILQAIGNQPLAWLTAQLAPERVTTALHVVKGHWTSDLALQHLVKYAQKKRDMRDDSSLDNSAGQGQETNNELMTGKKQLAKQVMDLTELTIQQGIESDSPFFWHLVDFFSNHFSVSANNIEMRALAPTLELEAIAPKVTGHFSSLLQAVVAHPAMLLYLNNEKSVGPNTRFAQKRKDKGLNENLGREILELHTLGVGSQYKQEDVTELAKALTGWSIGRGTRQEATGFLFRDGVHEPGVRVVLGKRYRQQGMAQGQAILADLANHPDTARHVSRKLVQHFIADQGNENIVNTMVDTWLSHQGNLAKVLMSMLSHPESWQSQAQKLKTPRELLISSCRVCSIPLGQADLIRHLSNLGQRPFNAGSPAGYKDNHLAWSGPHAMMSRIEWASHVSRFVRVDPISLAQQSLGPLLSKLTIQQMQQAESKEQAVALFLLSPEFQRR
jgi:uncharacterized protein (DUF1800 family)